MAIRKDKGRDEQLALAKLKYPADKSLFNPDILKVGRRYGFRAFNAFTPEIIEREHELRKLAKKKGLL